MRRSFCVSVVLLFVVTLVCAADVDLSERIRKVIDDKGLDAARTEIPMMIIQAAGKTPADESKMLALADEYLREGNTDAAELVASMQMVLGSSANVFAKQGDIYMAKEAPFLAWTFYQQALVADPGHAHAKSRLAYIAENHPEVAGSMRVPEPPPAPKSPPKTAPMSGSKDSANEGAAQRRGGLLPRVLVTSNKEAQSIDWDALRRRAGSDYPSRWDDLTLLDTCLWLSAAEVKEHLGLSVRVTSRTEDYQCKYRVHLADGDAPLILSLHVELHNDADYPRESKTTLSTGIGAMQYKAFDVDADDLTVLVHHKGKSLYVFPRDGRSYWRLGYMGQTPQRDTFYSPPAVSGVARDIGPRFMQLLVAKFTGQL